MYGLREGRTIALLTGDRMSKKKDCFGSETYVCRTRDCPYVTDCVQVVWDKKLRRIIARKGTTQGGGELRSSASVRVRSKEFLTGR